MLGVQCGVAGWYNQMISAGKCRCYLVLKRGSIEVSRAGQGPFSTPTGNLCFWNEFIGVYCIIYIFVDIHLISTLMTFLSDWKDSIERACTECVLGTRRQLVAGLPSVRSVPNVEPALFCRLLTSDICQVAAPPPTYIHVPHALGQKWSSWIISRWRWWRCLA